MSSYGTSLFGNSNLSHAYMKDSLRLCRRPADQWWNARKKSSNGTSSNFSSQTCLHPSQPLVTASARHLDLNLSSFGSFQLSCASPTSSSLTFYRRTGCSPVVVTSFSSQACLSPNRYVTSTAVDLPFCFSLRTFRTGRRVSFTSATSSHENGDGRSGWWSCHRRSSNSTGPHDFSRRSGSHRPEKTPPGRYGCRRVWRSCKRHIYRRSVSQRRGSIHDSFALTRLWHQESNRYMKNVHRRPSVFFSVYFHRGTTSALDWSVTRRRPLRLY